MPKVQKINLSICPKCKSRTTKIYDLSSEHPYECQLCRTHYSENNYLQIKKERKRMESFIDYFLKNLNL